jgi:hypothetical protein
MTTITPPTIEELLAALLDAVDELKACSAWEDALNGEDAAMLDTVNKAEALIARSHGHPHEPIKAICRSFRDDGRGCCITCGNFHGPEA